MMFDLSHAAVTKKLIESGPINSIIKYAQMACPDECCGFILEDGVVIPALNVIESLYDKSITSRTAFLIDSNSWERASSNTSKIICIYHSHTNGDPEMSIMDKSSLRWPNLYYLVIGVFDKNPTSSKLFWWQDKDLHALNIKL